MAEVVHIPVLLETVITFLNPKPGGFFIDGTLGDGGYAEKILARLAGQGVFAGFDWDASMLERAHKRVERAARGAVIYLVHGNFASIPEFLAEKRLGRANGVVLDLGWATPQFTDSGRGFGFGEKHAPEPLLMTPRENTRSVKDILREISLPELIQVLREFGEERYAARIARAIKEVERHRVIGTNHELTEIVKRAVPGNYEHGRIHPATRTFQALRIYANRELENLEQFLKNLGTILQSGGRAVVVSYHSLEDRLVKNAFRSMAKAGTARILTKKPISPSTEEITANRRARSAKLRAVEII